MTSDPLCCEVASAVQTSNGWSVAYSLLVPLQREAFGSRSSRLHLLCAVWMCHVLQTSLLLSYMYNYYQSKLYLGSKPLFSIQL